jgi:hypothetical protein
MAKNNKIKPIQLLSPENYIRQKVRNLPIYECKVNAGWEEERMAQVLITRNHANGNITLGFYLVDLGCLGVKDSFYRFNISPDEYTDMLEKFEDRMPFDDISYTLAHNIVYAGVQYAEELGFKPHKDFTSVTRFMLEEDTDEIELMEIEMGGEDGKPLYINAGFDSEVRVKQILAQLEKSVGVGNFNYLLQVGDLEDDDDESPNFIEIDTPEKFLSLMNKGLGNLNDAETAKLIRIMDELYLELCDEDIVYDYIDLWDNELNITLTNEITNEFIGIEENVVIKPKQYQLIEDILIQLVNDIKEASKNAIKLEKQIGTTSFTAFVELDLLKENESSKYPIMLAEYLQAYPICPLIKLLNHVEKFRNNMEADLNEYLPNADIIFENRDAVTEYEMYRYLIEKLFLIGAKNNIHLIEAYFKLLDDIQINENAIVALKGMAGILKIGIMKVHLEKKRT